MIATPLLPSHPTGARCCVPPEPPAPQPAACAPSRAALPVRLRQLLTPPAALSALASSAQGQRDARLPFIVRPARTREDLLAVTALRAAAYGRHNPHARRLAHVPDEFDTRANAVVLLAQDKHDARVLGSIRVVLGSAGSLELDRYVRLPHDALGQSAEAARLVVDRMPTALRLSVKVALWKAYYQICQAHRIDSMVLAARWPVQHDYAWLTFSPLQADSGEPLEFMPGAAFPHLHRVFWMPLQGMEARWRQMAHPFHRILFAMDHPDIDALGWGPINPLAHLADQHALAARPSALN